MIISCEGCKIGAWVARVQLAKGGVWVAMGIWGGEVGAHHCGCLPQFSLGNLSWGFTPLFLYFVLFLFVALGQIVDKLVFVKPPPLWAATFYIAVR